MEFLLTCYVILVVHGLYVILNIARESEVLGDTKEVFGSQKYFGTSLYREYEKITSQFSGKGYEYFVLF